MNDKIKNIIVSILFLGLIIGLMFINIFTKDNEISISERRKLEQFPKLTLTTLLNHFLKNLINIQQINL